MDVRLIKIDQVVTLIACVVQQRADLGDKRLPFLRVGAAGQLVGLLPRQFEPVQRAANGLAAAAAAKLCLHEASQTSQCPAWLYIGSGDWRTDVARHGLARQARQRYPEPLRLHGISRVAGTRVS